jgi:serine protease Do
VNGRRAVRRGVALGLVLASVLALAPGSASGGERWGWLGVRIRDLTENEMEDLTVKLGLDEGYGVVIAELLKGAPAEASGLKAGDLVVAIDGRPVVETRELQRVVGSAPAGRELRLVVLRDGRRREIRVRVGQMPPEIVAERIAAEFGFLVRSEAPEDEASEAEARAAVVTAVSEGSPAARGGLLVGDRVLAVDGAAVGSLERFRQRLQDVLLRDPLRLRVERRGEPVSVVLPPARPALLSQ